MAAAIAAGEEGAAAAASVTLVHRRDDVDADEATRARLNALRSSGRVEFVAGLPEAAVEKDGKLAALTVLGSDGDSRDLPLDALFVLLGWSPKLGPIGHNIRLSAHTWDPQLSSPRFDCICNPASFIGDYFGIDSRGGFTYTASVETFNAAGENPEYHQQQLVSKLRTP